MLELLRKVYDLRESIIKTFGEVPRDLLEVIDGIGEWIAKEYEQRKDRK